jgi:acetylornithine deacetylase/succinyl-diaminopimelate desuccinylase-like protein
LLFGLVYDNCFYLDKGVLMSDFFQQIENMSDSFRRLIVDLTIAISRAKTVNYNVRDFPATGPDGMESPGEEYKVVNILQSELEKRLMPCRIFARNKKRPNLLCSVGRGEKGYRKLLVLLHTDTVPSGGRELWNFDPFEPFEKEGKLFGRGVLDNKGPLAASFATLTFLKQFEKEIPGEFIFGAVPDEEVGIYGVGLDYLLSQQLIQCTDAIIPDIAGEMKKIDVAEKGRLGLCIKVHGKQAHAMDPSKGANAIDAACELAARIEKHVFSFNPHPLLGGPTKNLGLIRGGSAPNNVAADCELIYDLRVVPGMKAETIIEELEKIAAAINRKNVRFEFQADRFVPPTEVSQSAPVLSSILKFAPDAVPFGMGGGTFCKELIRELGIDAVGFAPGADETYHMANEEIEVKQLVDFAGVLAKIAWDICLQKSD